MTYITGSMTSANPAADLYTQMATALSSAGFTLVDTVVIGTRTHKVWQCAAANNAQNLKWYLDVAYTTTGAGSVWLGAFEDYDTVNHLGIRGPYNNNTDSNLPEATYYSRYGATGFALETNWSYVANNTAQIQTQVTAYAYWISITGDRVMVMTSVAPTNVIYCGFFDMYTPWANKIGSLAYPLITTTMFSPSAGVNATTHNANSVVPAGYGSGSVTQCAINRRPPVAQAGWNNSGGQNGYYASAMIQSIYERAASSVGGYGYGSPMVPVDTGVSQFFDLPRGGKLLVSNQWYTADGTGGGGVGIIIGSLKDIAVFCANTVTRGDSITISSQTWILTNVSSGRTYGFKAI